MCSATPRKQKKTQKGTTPTSSLTTQYVDSEVSDVIFSLYTVCLHFLFPIRQTFQNDYYCYAFYIFSIEFGEI